ncbi:MAG: radical SAM family heme chaperone HemW [Flavobacteriales bacterium]|jgi:oxygen-independent coproporphyrinogen-3 oxidase|nr:radical SAM family heme chaperone HemW [Flavobacteriales bacterium]
MAGIYIHIPFCKKACHYCDFHFSTSLRFKAELLNALSKEIEQQVAYLEDEEIETIYFGGGTPSLLLKDELKELLNQVRDNYQVVECPEITLEANPDDLTREKLLELKEIGINRLSIGVQSFFDEHLEWMNRAHSSSESETCIKTATELGFKNITLDLIYGMPNLSNEEWEMNIQKAIALGVGHISAYNLTMEEQTAYAHFVKKGVYQAPSDEKGAEQFSMLIAILEKAGYQQYETSNFAKEEAYSKHNSAYWRGKKYLGIGPSAHSYNGISRQWNIANNKRYIDAVNNGNSYFEQEELTNIDRVNEHLLIGLRTVWGCDLKVIQRQLEGRFYQGFLKELEHQKLLGMIHLNNNKFYLTPQGKLFADRVASDLFVE